MGGSSDEIRELAPFIYIPSPNAKKTLEITEFVRKPYNIYRGDTVIEPRSVS